MRSYTDELTPPVLVDTPIPSGAGFGIRFLARLLDLIYGFLLSLPAGFVAGIACVVLASSGVIDANWVERIQEKSLSGFGLGLLGAFLYHSMSEGIGGTSVGKLVCGLNVVQMNGQPCTMLGALKRDLLYHVDGLFLGLIGYQSMKTSALQQRYGDTWGKTVVVKKDVYLPNPARPAWRMVAGIILGSMMWMSAVIAQVMIKAF